MVSIPESPIRAKVLGHSAQGVLLRLKYGVTKASDLSKAYLFRTFFRHPLLLAAVLPRRLWMLPMPPYCVNGRIMPDQYCYGVR